MAIPPVYIGPNCRYTFLENPEEGVKARLEAGEVPVYQQGQLVRSIKSVDRLLRNWHFQPQYVQDPPRIDFIPSDSHSTTWAVCGEIDIPEGACICWRSNGTLSYAYANTVVTWSWITGTRTQNAYTVPITSLSEDARGELVVNPDVANAPQNPQPVLQENKLHFNGKEFALEGKTIEGFQKLSDTKVLVNLKGNDVEVVLWDTQLDKQTMITDGYLQEAIDCKQVIEVDADTFVFPRYYRGPSARFYTNSGTKRTDVSAGAWRISSMILLSNGSVMFATTSTPSGIHVATKDRIAFSSTELTNNWNVKSLTELVDGSVAICTERWIRIIRPQMVPDRLEQQVDYQIEKCMLDLKFNPHRLDLYHKLADLQDKPEAVYQILLAGLKAAMNNAQLYPARRFYEKARTLQPRNPEPCHLFLQYLETTHDHKQKRRVELDLHALQNPDSVLEPRSYKKRLLVGELHFSYTVALIQKHLNTHPGLGRSITATEYLQPPRETSEKIDFLIAQGVQILWGIDATKLHETFRGKRFERIQWNCPFGKSGKEADKIAFRECIPQFFIACSGIQMVGDRVHVTLMQEKGHYWKERQQENPIVLGASYAGYRLIRKRLFGEGRYPGYKHETSSGQIHHSSKDDEMREFVFQKVDLVRSRNLAEARALEDRTIKQYRIEPDQVPHWHDHYFVCSSDEDSSDYEEE